MNRAGAVAFVVIVALASASFAPSTDHAAARQATPSPVAAPLHLLAASAATTPAPGDEVVWLVQRGAVFGARQAIREPVLLGFALSRRGTLGVLDADGATVAEIRSGRAAPVPRNAGGYFASATGDLTLFVQIALVPVSALPPSPLPESSITAPFRIAGSGAVSLELVRSFVNPGQATVVPAPDAPALLLATDNPIRVAYAGGIRTVLGRDEAMLIDEAATIRNDGASAASFVAARIVAAPDIASAAMGGAADAVAQPLDPVVEEAWRRNGCHLNPANAACATAGVAAACAVDPSEAACIADGDGDGCADVPEILAAFDPFDPDDCLSGASGVPAVNCLFPVENVACDVNVPQDACLIAVRDPGCDGFPPGGG